MKNFALILSFLSLFTSSIAAPSPVRKFLAENQLEDAIAVCRQFEVLSTNDPDNFLGCAWVYYRTGRISAGDKILERAKKSSRLPEYQLLMIYSNVVRAQVSPDELKSMTDDQKKRADDMVRAKYDEAQKKLEPLIMEHRGTTVGRNAQELNAEFYELKGQLDPAAFIYKGLVTEDPNRARAHWGLGRYYLARGDNARAITHLLETTRLWPTHMGSRFNLGVVYMNQGPEFYREAARWLGDAYRLNKADSGVLEQIGILFEKKQRLPDALKYWQRAIEVNPEAMIAREKLNTYFVQVVDFLMSQKKYFEALAKIENGNPALTGQLEYKKRRGIIYRNIGRYDKAVAELKEYLNSQPKDGQALRELGIAYVNLKQLDSAMNSFSKSAAVEPGNGMNHAWLAFGYETKKEFVKALESWKRASELLKESDELEKATRKITSLEKQVSKSKGESRKKKKDIESEFDEEMGE